MADLAHYVSRETKDFVWNKENKDQIPTPYGKLAPWSLGSAPSKQLAKSVRSKTIGMEFALLPAGTFMMGSPISEVDRRENETQRKVTIGRPFYLGKYEVTQQEFQRVMGFNPSQFTGSNRLPVEQVSWFDAVWFCNKLSELDGFQASYRIGQIEKDGDSIKSAKVDVDRRAGEVARLGRARLLPSLSALANMSYDYWWTTGRNATRLRRSVALPFDRPPIGSPTVFLVPVWSFIRDGLKRERF